MELTGQQIIAGKTAAEGKKTFTVSNPATGEKLTPAFAEATDKELDRAMQAADEAFEVMQTTTPLQRADFLEAIAVELEALGQPLLDRAHAETALPMPRLTGERGRMIGQTKLFAQMIREGSWTSARIDHADPARQPLPKPDVRLVMVPIGPVVVFGASNFPFAISVAGTDTLCAFGAGCPVVVKAHPAHPGTCELLAGAIVKAAEKSGMPAGVFSLVQGVSDQVGLQLVKDPRTEAVAFTGSLGGGRAIFNAAAARPRPIPVYAEMGSTNPVFLLPGALKERGTQIAEGYIQSVTLGTGQFCTNPGVVLGLQGESLDGFINSAAGAAAKVAPSTMLHAGICSSFQNGVERMAATQGVEVAGKSATPADPAKSQAACTIFKTDIDTLNREAHLMHEVFGPTSIVVKCRKKDELLAFARSLDGHLTATLHGTEKDLLEHQDLVRVLQRKVGRLIFNGFPTGIEVCHAMHHGGPYPATTDGHFTSIGTGSIFRFVRPLCYQNFPEAALPDELKDANPRKIWRLVDGEMKKE